MHPSIDLSGLWRFQPDPLDEGEKRGLHRPEHDASRWLEANVPAPFDDASPALASYEGKAWYRRDVVLPPPSAETEPVLCFAGVNYQASVWLNGQLLGEHRGGFLPFEFSLAAAGGAGVNTLVVRADSTRREGEVPGLRRGWRPYGGILREVIIEHRPRLRLERPVFVTPADGRGRVHVAIVNRTGRTRRVRVELTLIRPGSAPTPPPPVTFPGEAIRVAPDSESPCEIAFHLPNPLPWSPQSPSLYQARVTLIDLDAPGASTVVAAGGAAGAIADETEVAVGFRTVESRGGRLFLNGAPLRFCGFNRHEDTPRAGMTPDPLGARADLLHIKSLGANFVRLCHYPHHPSTLDLCDELGLLAMGEIPLYWWGGPEGATPSSQKLAAAEDQLRAMIARDLNHPALIFWSVSNETDETHPDVAAGNAHLVALARRLDPTRLAVHVSDRWTRVQHFEHDQAACLNGYPSFNAAVAAPEAADLFEKGQAWWRDELEKLHRARPDLPIVISEFGCPGLAGVIDGRVGEADQLRAIRAEAEAFMLPHVAGIVLWCYADHPWPEEPFLKRVVISPYGLFTRERKPKLAGGAIAEIFRAFMSAGS